MCACDFNMRSSILSDAEDTNLTQWEEPPSFLPAPP